MLCIHPGYFGLFTTTAYVVNYDFIKSIYTFTDFSIKCRRQTLELAEHTCKFLDLSGFLKLKIDFFILSIKFPLVVVLFFLVRILQVIPYLHVGWYNEKKCHQEIGGPLDSGPPGLCYPAYPIAASLPAGFPPDGSAFMLQTN